MKRFTLVAFSVVLLFAAACGSESASQSQATPTAPNFVAVSTEIRFETLPPPKLPCDLFPAKSNDWYADGCGDVGGYWIVLHATFRNGGAPGHATAILFAPALNQHCAQPAPLTQWDHSMNEVTIPELIPGGANAVAACVIGTTRDPSTDLQVKVVVSSIQPYTLPDGG